MRIVSTAPTRIGFVGGGTDVDPFASRFGGKVLSFALNIRHATHLQPDNTRRITIEAMGERRVVRVGARLSYNKDSKFDLIYAILNHFRTNISSGCKLSMVFDGKFQAGIGSSANAAVSLIGALSSWLQVPMSRMEIAMLAWEMETKELGWIEGKQDQLAAAFGGINRLIFGPGEVTKVEPLRLPTSTVQALRRWTLLAFLPNHRHSSSIQKKLRRGMNETEKQQALVRLRDSVDVAIRLLEREDWQGLGRLLDEAWVEKKKSNPAVTTPEIDRVYSLAKDSGALGGKIMGAGGAGYMFFFVPPDRKEGLRERLLGESLAVIPFDYDFEGLRVRRFSGGVRKSHWADVRRGFSPKRGSPAVFLDRDGVISVEKHLVHRLRDFELIPGAAEAIKRLNSDSIPIIVYHNASVVARGLTGVEQVVKLHGKMKQLLAKKGAYADAILFCPHHPQAFDPRYEYDCEWRKPKPGMLTEARRRFGIDLTRSYVVGDSARDVLMGKAVGARTMLVQTGHAGEDMVFEARPDTTVKDLPEAVHVILKRLG